MLQSLRITTAESGGVLEAWGSSNVIVHASHFTSDSAGAGGVVWAWEGSIVTVHASHFTSNSAGFGGVVFAQKGSIVTVHASHFTSNSAVLGGVVYALYGSSVMVHTSHFSSNSARWDGGVVYAQEGSSVTVYASHFTSNSAVWEGGVVYAGEGSSVTVHTSHFPNNSARQDGGVVYAGEGCYVTVHASLFAGNSGEEGGVVYVGESNVTVHVSNFTSNSAGHVGGVVCAMEGSSVTINVSHFTINSAGLAGGVISAVNRATVAFHDSNFNSNSVGSDWLQNYSRKNNILEVGWEGGGVLYAINCSVALYTSYFARNEAGWGACIFIDGHNETFRIVNGVPVTVASGSSVVFIFQCYFTKNTASQSGAAMSALKTLVFVSETRFAENKGTAIFEYTEDTDQDHKNASFIENCVFANNLGKVSNAAADVFFTSPVQLQNISIRKMWNHKDSHSVITLGKTLVTSLNVTLEEGYPSTVVFIGLLFWDSKIKTIVHVICPKSTKPSVKLARALKEGASGASILCEWCPFGYYFGKRSVSFGLYEKNQARKTCRTEVSWNDPKRKLYSFCFSLKRSCSNCPYGANCLIEGEVVSLPNFYGWSQNGQITMLRCPQGYCCQNRSCQGINSCADNRGGFFCGRCRHGFTESIFSSFCNADTNCMNTWWFVLLYIRWIALGCFLLFLSTHKNISRKQTHCLKHPKHFEQLIRSMKLQVITMKRTMILAMKAELQFSSCSQICTYLLIANLLFSRPILAASRTTSCCTINTNVEEHTVCCFPLVTGQNNPF